MRAVMLNRPFVAFLCFLLLLKAVVPVGYMPDLNALSHGSLKITICSSSGPKQIYVDATSKDMGTTHHQKHADKGGSDVCPFGAAPHNAVIPFLFIFVLLAFVWFRHFRTQSDELPAYAPYAAYARGPPVL